MTAHRGRRPAGSGTRDAIAVAARRQFAEHGYPGTTLRAIAQEAGVDTRLVAHYFGSKQELFATVLELPFDPATVIDVVIADDLAGVGRRLAEFLFSVLDSPEGGRTVTGMLRAAASEDQAALMIRDVLVERVLTPVTARLGGENPQRRAALMGSQIAGMAFARYIVKLPPLVDADSADLAAAIGPVLEYYLTAPLDGTATIGVPPPVGDVAGASAGRHTLRP
jgi:AcrR family transcriptional regulator